MSSNKQAKFNKDWIKETTFSGLVGVDLKSDTKARYMLYSSFELGNMRRKSLVNHASGIKHQLKVQLSVKVKQEI